ncbi:hypothetical protein ACS0TY_021168 [Phlomoides rotata]
MYTPYPQNEVIIQHLGVQYTIHLMFHFLARMNTMSKSHKPTKIMLKMFRLIYLVVVIEIEQPKLRWNITVLPEISHELWGESHGHNKGANFEGKLWPKFTVSPGKLGWSTSVADSSDTIKNRV